MKPWLSSRLALKMPVYHRNNISTLSNEIIISFTNPHSRQWTSDQNKDMVRPCNAQRNFRKPKRTSQRLQASVIIINNNKKSSWQQMRKILIDDGLFGRVARRRHFLSNKYLVVCCMWTKHQTSAQIPHKICQHGGGGVMIWPCSATTEPGHPAFMNLTMNSSVHLSILESNMRLSVGQLKLGWNWVILQDNNPMHNSKSAAEWAGGLLTFIQFLSMKV